MPRLRQIVFIASLLGLCWLGMQAVHELGHVAAAMLTGGEVSQVVLHPLTISRTDLGVNPRPLVVVWAGPLAGVLLPLAAAGVRWFVDNLATRCVQFFAGFCLIANGAYIGLGTFERIGDCDVMLRHGTPMWVMIAFGIVAIITGLGLWHRLGSPRDFFTKPDAVSAWAVVLVSSSFLAMFALGLLFSPS